MPAFELYDSDGLVRMSSSYPTFQYVSKSEVTSFGDGVVTSNREEDWDQMRLGSHLMDTDNKWYRYLFDEARTLPLPNAGEPSLILYDDKGEDVTFILKYPVMNILDKQYIGEPKYTPSLDYRTHKIPMGGRKLSLSRLSSTGPTIFTLIGTYTYHNQRYYNYRVTNYWIEPVFNYTTKEISFRKGSNSYISEGHTSPAMNSDNYLSMSVLIVDVTGV